MKVDRLRIVQACALIASGCARAVGEIIQIGAGGQTLASGLFAAVALAAFAFGLTGIWHDARQGVLGRVATIATVIGAASFVVVTLHSVIVLGAPPAQEVARTLPFLSSAVATLIGVAALSAWLIRAPAYPNWVGVLMIATVAGSVTTSAIDVPAIVQPLIDIVMAASFVQFGLSMLATAKTPVPHRPVALDEIP